MSPEIGLAMTRVALFLIVAAGLALLWVRRGSAEFVVLILTIGVALVMLGVVTLFARQGTARWSRRPTEYVPFGGPDDRVPGSQSAGEVGVTPEQGVPMPPRGWTGPKGLLRSEPDMLSSGPGPSDGQQEAGE